MRNPTQFLKNPFRPVKTQQPVDPRLTISKHIGWVRTTTDYTEFSVPEPINYNRALFYNRPVECKFIRDAVYYRDRATGLWGSVWYVPKEQAEEFDRWCAGQEHDYIWKYTTYIPLKPVKRLLFNRKNSVDITDNERLYTMGYYESLANKYFSEDDTMLSERLGPVRIELLTDVFEVE